MPFTIYKPNKNVKGALLNVNFVARADKGKDKGDKSFYFKLVEQTGWNEKERTGSFTGGKLIVSKMAPHEAAGIIYSITHNVPLNEAMNNKYVYHDGKNNSSIINFGPAYRKIRDGDKYVDSNEQVGFGFRVTTTEKENKDNKFSLGVGFTFAEAELLRKYLDDGLTHICDAWFSEEIARLKDYNENKKKKTEATPKEPVDNTPDDPDDGSGDPADVEF